MTRLCFALAHLLALTLVFATICALALGLVALVRQLHPFG
jgi:hypothetical protein